MGNQSNQPTLSKPKFALRIAVILALAFSAAWATEQVVLPKGDSVPYSVMWRTPNATPGHLDYVNLEIEHEIIGDQAGALTKQIVCDEGQQLTFSDDQFYCDEQLLGSYITETWDGKALTPFQYSGAVPSGQAFLMGSHPRSFDSRYFGFVPKTELTVVRGIL